MNLKRKLTVKENEGALPLCDILLFQHLKMFDVSGIRYRFRYREILTFYINGDYGSQSGRPARDLLTRRLALHRLSHRAQQYYAEAILQYRQKATYTSLFFFLENGKYYFVCVCITRGSLLNKCAYLVLK